MCVPSMFRVRGSGNSNHQVVGLLLAILLIGHSIPKRCQAAEEGDAAEDAEAAKGKSHEDTEAAKGKSHEEGAEEERLISETNTDHDYSLEDSKDGSGKCYICKRDAKGKDCLNNNKAESVPCHQGDAESVRCLSYLVVSQGPKNSEGNREDEEERFEARKEGKGCLRESHQKCALEHLKLELEDGKCLRTVRNGESFADFLKCTNTSIWEREIIKDPIDGDEGDSEQFAVAVVCSCKGENCNKENLDDHKDKMINENQGKAKILQCSAFIVVASLISLLY